MPEERVSSEAVARARAMRRLLCGFVFAAVLLNTITHFETRSFTSDVLYWAARDRNWPGGEYLQVDRLLNDVPPDANIFLRVEGFHEKDDGVLSLIYYRAVYTLHPRRVFVSEEPKIINRGRDLIAVTAVPDAAWLAENNIQMVLTATRIGKGRIQYTKTPPEEFARKKE